MDGTHPAKATGWCLSGGGCLLRQSGLLFPREHFGLTKLPDYFTAYLSSGTLWIVKLPLIGRLRTFEGFDGGTPMTGAIGAITDVESARAVLETYEVVTGVYLLGSLSKGVTVYRQQVRAHNLARALTVPGAVGGCALRDIAVVGGGIGGLTVAAALVAVDDNVRITLYEKRWDLCPLQQGCDTRWLHPRIYDWPEKGSRLPSSDLRVLGWKEGRASDVSETILREFAKYCAWSAKHSDETDPGENERIRIFLGLSHLRVNAKDSRIEWMGHLSKRYGNHFRPQKPEGDTKKFDAIILASGFGLERGHGPEEVNFSTSYWRSDRLGQPSLEGTAMTYVVSGYGDGAIVDICRLTIERFRQDTIIYELFGDNIDHIESTVLQEIEKGRAKNIFNLKILIEQSDNFLELIRKLLNKMSDRLRKDTKVILHAKGSGEGPRTIDKLFGPGSSILNRMLLYLLYRAGAFLVRFNAIDEVKREFNVPSSNVVQRHGTLAYEAVLDLFVDPVSVAPHLDEMRKDDRQSTEQLFSLGYFAAVPEGIGS